MKRLIVFLISCLLIFGTVFPAFATDESILDKYGTVEEYIQAEIAPKAEYTVNTVVEDTFKMPFIASAVLNVILLFAVIVFAVLFAKAKRKPARKKSTGKAKSASLAKSGKKPKAGSKGTARKPRSKTAPVRSVPAEDEIVTEPVVEITVEETSVPEILRRQIYVPEERVDRSWLGSVKESILYSYQNGVSFNFEHYYADIDDFQSSISGEKTVTVRDKTSTHFVVFCDGDDGKMYLLPNPRYYNNLNRRFSLIKEEYGNYIGATNGEKGVIVDFRPTRVEETFRDKYSVDMKGVISWE